MSSSTGPPLSVSKGARRRSAGPRRDVAGWLALSICLALVAALTTVRSEEGTENRYLIQTVGVGQLGTLREFDVQVDKVELANGIADDSSLTSTEHVFVVVTLTAHARTREQHLSFITLRTTDGRTYTSRSQWFTAATPGPQAGFSARGTQVFEIPAFRVPGAALRVEPSAGEITHVDRAVQVDLGLTAETPRAPVAVTLPAPATWVTP